MARGRKKTLSEQIKELEIDIEKYEEALTVKYAQREELLKLQREEEISELYEFLKENNVTVHDIRSMLNQDKIVQIKEYAS